MPSHDRVMENHKKHDEKLAAEKAAQEQLEQEKPRPSGGVVGGQPSYGHFGGGCYS